MIVERRNKEQTCIILLYYLFYTIHRYKSICTFTEVTAPRGNQSSSSFIVKGSYRMRGGVFTPPDAPPRRNQNQRAGPVRRWRRRTTTCSSCCSSGTAASGRHVSSSGSARTPSTPPSSPPSVSRW